MFTLKRRRAGIVSLAKAIVAATEIVPESLQELTDPEVLEAAAEALSDANSGGEYPSEYLETLLKAVRKIARSYLCRPPEDLARIDERAGSGNLNRGVEWIVRATSA
jgi:lipid A disaccharide synthetase